ncbi:hypothetical protein FVE85_2186 [Porphyridium purpureum]|uniref:Uncharacterized protein n=1 Tax=Porphyridium purpureum TaxID=35688 RepID=A0A5J4YWT9_PORPP|nr:hypothetical protein FVE85_2186 [Porphyridium purpureum]|eukprot:POR6355..scf209_3
MLVWASRRMEKDAEFHAALARSAFGPSGVLERGPSVAVAGAGTAWEALVEQCVEPVRHDLIQDAKKVLGQAVDRMMEQGVVPGSKSELGSALRRHFRGSKEFADARDAVHGFVESERASAVLNRTVELYCEYLYESFQQSAGVNSGAVSALALRQRSASASAFAQWCARRQEHTATESHVPLKQESHVPALSPGAATSAPIKDEAAQMSGSASAVLVRASVSDPTQADEQTEAQLDASAHVKVEPEGHGGPAGDSKSSAVHQGDTGLSPGACSLPSAPNNALGNEHRDTADMVPPKSPAAPLPSEKVQSVADSDLAIPMNLESSPTGEGAVPSGTNGTQGQILGPSESRDTSTFADSEDPIAQAPKRVKMSP